MLVRLVIVPCEYEKNFNLILLSRQENIFLVKESKRILFFRCALGDTSKNPSSKRELQDSYSSSQITEKRVLS